MPFFGSAAIGPGSMGSTFYERFCKMDRLLPCSHVPSGGEFPLVNLVAGVVLHPEQILNLASSGG